MQNTTNYEQKNQLQLLRDGNHNTFTSLFKKHKKDVIQCCRRFGLRPDEVEDVANETFLAAYKGLHQYKNQAEFGTWLWSISYRKIINHLKKHKRKRLLESSLHKQYFDNKVYEPITIIHSRETERSIWEAVMLLPSLWALSIFLYYREGKSVADISKIMKTNENTVKTYLFRARKRLKYTLASVYQDSIEFY